MPPHSLGSGTISFGLVSIPVRMYTAASSAACRSASPCQSVARESSSRRSARRCNEVVDRASLVRAATSSRGPVRPRHRRRLEGARGGGREGRHRRVRAAPGGRSDLLQKTYYLGRQGRRQGIPKLLADAMEGRAVAGPFVMRGKEASCSSGRRAAASCCTRVLRRRGTRLRRDRPRPVGEDQAGELELALQLIDGLASDEFQPVMPGRVPPPRPRPRQPEGPGQGLPRSDRRVQRASDRPDGGARGGLAKRVASGRRSLWRRSSGPRPPRRRRRRRRLQEVAFRVRGLE